MSKEEGPGSSSWPASFNPTQPVTNFTNIPQEKKFPSFQPNLQSQPFIPKSFDPHSQGYQPNSNFKNISTSKTFSTDSNYQNSNFNPNSNSNSIPKLSNPNPNPNPNANSNPNFRPLQIKEFHPSQNTQPRYSNLKWTPHDHQNEEFNQNYIPEPQQQQHHHHLPPQNITQRMYPSPLPHVTHFPANKKTSQYFFMDEKLRETLTAKNEAIINPIGSVDNLPEELTCYHSLSKIGEKKSNSSLIDNSTSLYKAISSIDGMPYILRRVEAFRVTNPSLISEIQSWRNIVHPNVINLREAFTTKLFGDSSLIFVYDYHPLAKSCYETFFCTNNTMVNEDTLWSFIIQVSSAIKAVHSAGKACRMLDLTKILVTSRNRFRLNCLGMMDVLKPEEGKSLLDYQQQDLLTFGSLIVNIACNSLTALQNPQKTREFISRHYSPDLQNILTALFSPPSESKIIDDIIPLFGHRLFVEIDRAHIANDRLESELAKELENGRLFRLMCKLGFVNERPEYEGDSSWSETGDRYILKLFRDYVFHQVEQDGSPVLNLSHVISCLNKLDVGHPEKVLLMSRDELSCIIVSYADLKKCLENAFIELKRKK